MIHPPIALGLLCLARQPRALQLLCHYNAGVQFFSFFFFNDTATPEIYTLSLHDALPIFEQARTGVPQPYRAAGRCRGDEEGDRKSTRLNSSNGSISYAVFCLKKNIRNHAATCACSPAQRGPSAAEEDIDR